MMSDLRELERQVARLKGDFATWRRDAVARPIRQPASGAGIGQTRFGVVREIGTGTEPYIMVQFLRQIVGDPGWAFASGTSKQVACYGDLVSAEYKIFLSTIPDEYAGNVGFKVIPMVREALSWVACPWTAFETIAIDDMGSVPRTDCFPPVGGGGGGVPVPLSEGSPGGLTPAVLDDLVDVTISGDQVEGEIPSWDNTAAQWINRTLAEAGILSADGAVGLSADWNAGSHKITVQELATDTISEKTAGAGVTADGVLLKDGLVAGRNVATDGTKLDGIESGATADQSAADIRTLGFFDISNDGAGSGLDADLLDGSHASAFAASIHTHSQYILSSGLSADWDAGSYKITAQEFSTDTISEESGGAGVTIDGVQCKDSEVVLGDNKAVNYGASSDAQIYWGGAASKLTFRIGSPRMFLSSTELEVRGTTLLDQTSTSGAVPVLRLNQADIDDSFINFIGTSAADGSRSISSDTTEDSAKFGALRVEINGVTKWIRVYDDES